MRKRTCESPGRLAHQTLLAVVLGVEVHSEVLSLKRCALFCSVLFCSALFCSS